MIFVQFLHLLAHHPDFALTQESVPDMAKYARRYTLPSDHRSDVVVPDISTSTLDLWPPQKMSRYCTILLEKQRLSVIQNRIFTARFANPLLFPIPEQEMTELLESLRPQRTCPTHYQRLGEATLMDPAKRSYESQATPRHLASFAECRSS